MTSVFFQGDGTRQKKVSKVGLPTGSMQLGSGCWVWGELSCPLPVICPECFCLWYPGASLCWLMQLAMGLDRQYPAPHWVMHVLKALDTNQAIAAPRLSTALQLPQKVVGCVFCRSSSLVANCLPWAIGLARVYMLYMLLQCQPDPSCDNHHSAAVPG